MPQLPTSTAEEYGAEDEIKEYRQEEEDDGDIDVVNDIKDDLINEDDEPGKDDQYRVPPNGSRFLNIKNEYGRGYGPSVIISPTARRWMDERPGFPPPTTLGGNTRVNPQNYSSSQIHMPPYGTRGQERSSFYDHPHWTPSQIPPYPSSMHYSSGVPLPKYESYGRYGPGMPMSSYFPLYGGHPDMPGRPSKEPKRPHVKKPLNAFMLYMKEQRPKIAAEFTLKESAAINQILGKRWHALDKTEQSKYYDLARRERALHMKLYPGWSARDNYAQFGRKKKRKKDKSEEMNPKKCRARYGLDRQEQWCKPCRRKKKCIRFIIGADGEAKEVPENEQVDNDEEDESDDNENEPDTDPNSQEKQPKSPGSDTDSKENLRSLLSATMADELKNLTEALTRGLAPAVSSAPVQSTPAASADTTVTTSSKSQTNGTTNTSESNKSPSPRTVQVKSPCSLIAAEKASLLSVVEPPCS